jgi:hypothetical protein
LAGALGLILGVALTPATASAHVERASYWPDSGVDLADGQPTGGAVPEARDLFTALDESAVGDTLVVCVGGASSAIPYRAPQPLSQRQQQPVNLRLDAQVSRAEVNRFERKLRKVRRGMKRSKKKGHSKKVAKKKKRARKLKRRLGAAKRSYRAALAAEAAARQAGALRFQQDVAAEQAAQQAADRRDAAERAAQAELRGHPSMMRLDAALDDAVANGYEIRPSEPRVQVTQQEADRLWDFNARLLARCGYDSIQDAVNDSGNNDRVVVMPGIYTEPDSRAVESHPELADNLCADMFEENDEGNTGALSYRYQFHCPNQQNLIAVMGREPKKNPDGSEFVPDPPAPADPRRDGIPDEGPCIRCNLQLEGSGISPDDVVVDSGRVESGNGAPMGSEKDVGIRVDRADGFVLRNMTVRHSLEHDIYSPETDGLLLERFKTYFNGHYGVLTFVAEHHLIQDCDAAGSGDAAIYPGSSAERGEQVDPNFDADDPNHSHTLSGGYSTEIRRCDMRHSNTGYSGTAANSVWVHHNDFYDNAMGFVTDVFTASGHPGFPGDSNLIEENEFYSNNFNPYVEDESGELAVCDSANGENPGPHGPDQGCTDVIPRIPAPVGTAFFIPGSNNNTIRDNRIWNNWRRGIMLFSVPDAFVCGEAVENHQHGCDESEVNTSHRNEFHDNVLGQAPDGTPQPNGDGDPVAMRTDFWWDEFLGNVRNCWYDNVGPNGDRDSLTSTPPLNPGGDTAPFVPHTLPGKGLSGDCSESVGTGGTPQEAELLNCLGDMEFDTGTCDWFLTPEKP